MSKNDLKKYCAYTDDEIIVATMPELCERLNMTITRIMYHLRHGSVTEEGWRFIPGKEQTWKAIDRETGEVVAIAKDSPTLSRKMNYSPSWASVNKSTGANKQYKVVVEEHDSEQLQRLKKARNYNEKERSD